MLNERKIARSYATAIFELSLEQGSVDLIASDMEMMQQLLEDNPELQRVLASPVLHKRKKKEILDLVLTGHVNHLTIRFLHLLVNAMRAVYLNEITSQFLVQYKAHQGIRVVKVKSAVVLGEGSRKVLLEKLRIALDSKIELQELVDPRLIGGFVVQIDDQRYDASIRSKLNKLDRQFDVNIYKKGF